MTLREHTSRVLDHLLGETTSATASGLHERWDLYRAMVRNRLLELARGAFPRTAGLLPPETFTRAFDAWLAASPPNTPYFWRVASELGSFLVTWSEGDAERPWLRDLVRLELACWNARNEDVPSPPTVEPLVFDRAPVLAPSLVLLDVDYEVESSFEQVPAARHGTLAVHRRADDRVSVLALNDAGAALVRELSRANGTLAESALAVARARDTRIDDAYFEALATLLAVLVEDGALLGSRLAA